MFENLQIMQMAQDSARHAGRRQALSAMNVANADTPGYRAMDVTDFAQSYRSASTSLQATRPGHITGADAAGRLRFREIEASGQTSPNGNSVSLEEELMRSVQAERQHKRAVTIYQHGLTVLKSTIGAR